MILDGLYTKEQLAWVTNNVALKTEPWFGAYRSLIRDIEESLKTEPIADADFNIPGAYIDGEGHVRNKQHLCHLGLTAHACALAYAVGGDEKYCKKAEELLCMWFDTNKSVSGHDGALSMCYLGTSLLFATELLQHSGKEKSEFIIKAENWVRNVFLPTANSIREGKNNWGDWGLLASVTAYRMLGDVENIKECARLLRKHIDETISSDGSMPRETARGNRGIWYTYFALALMTCCSTVIYNSCGTDLFSYVGNEGQSIRKALDFLLYYYENQNEWKYCEEKQDLLPFVKAWPFNLFEAMGDRYDCEKYTGFASNHRPVGSTAHHAAWSYTTLLAKRK